MITNAAEILNKELTVGSEAKSFNLNSGDCGLVIRNCGKVDIFQLGIDTEALSAAAESMSPADQQILINGQTLMALSIVAANPELQRAILSVAVNEGAVGIPAANSNG